MTREKQLQASCQSVHNEYKQCLSTSNRDPRKCADFVPKLRACEKRYLFSPEFWFIYTVPFLGFSLACMALL